MIVSRKMIEILILLKLNSLPFHRLLSCLFYFEQTYKKYIKASIAEVDIAKVGVLIVKIMIITEKYVPALTIAGHISSLYESYLFVFEED